MKRDRRINGGVAVIAAVTLIMQALSNLGINAKALIENPAAALPSVVISLAMTLLLVVVLLRKKKDTAAGVILLILAVFPLVSAVSYIVAMAKIIPNAGAYQDNYKMSAILNTVSTLLTVLFRVILAVECFKPGKIAGWLMLVLPWVTPVVAVFATAVLSMGDAGFTDLEMMALMAASGAVRGVADAGPVLCGMAFMAPTYEDK